MYYSPFIVTFTASLFISMQLLCKSVLFLLFLFTLKAYMWVIWPRLYMSYAAYGWGKEHPIFCSIVFVFLSSLLLFWSSNKANYKGEKKVGLVEREPLKPFLLQHGTKESTEGMARPQQKRKEKNHLMRMSR